VVDSETAEDNVDDTMGQSFAAFEKENITYPGNKDSEIKDKISSNGAAIFA